METQMKIRQKYIEKNGGLEKVFNEKENKDKYEKFLTKLYSISWKQKRNKK